ncbi:transglycosylase SLT domain-containing protein [Arhodomonas aquaeolei]|uniref:transglycosylase SLT domain-containing protein n=1 Tax=Arhodomonas aquaeolei TaxID=2369 RepID=UPI002167E310|nr:transglycosylase SLT domain-containing protein [Arhodomonas aquaeolei]MCS4503877.1 transglycosylase SLT domain-containing protein [Arhodomonas aquaeolei]
MTAAPAARLPRAAARIVWAAALSALICAPAWAGPIPEVAQQYQRELTRQAQQVWGLGGPVALFGAQVHQESAWRADVDSAVGAQGLAQFMPATSDWIVEIYPDLGAAAPYSPRWALAAMVRYDRHIYTRIDPMTAEAVPRCDRLAMMLAGYNGGPGWVSRDRRLAAREGADPDRWWGHVERHTNRADWAERENRHYPERIIHELEPRYLRAGWQGGASCP